jgi:hypothetical protein
VASFVAPQAILAVLMTKHRGKLAVLKEVVLVLTCLKPAVEIWRLAHGAAHEPGAPVDPKMARTFGKIAERVLESISRRQSCSPSRRSTTPTPAQPGRWRQSS